MIGRTIAAVCLSALLAGCASPQRPPRPPRLSELIDGGARVMWCAAHPDDEALAGAMLARASIGRGSPVQMLVFTHGEGGECCRPEGCLPDLATVRAGELGEVARLYRAGLRHERFWNAPLPVESFPPREEIAAIWSGQGDPALVAAGTIRAFRPDVLLTFDPDNGFTGHPEHQLASRFCTAGVRLAADPEAEVEGLPVHRVPHIYYALNRYWPFRLLGKADPGPVTEEWDARQRCGGRACVDVMADFTLPHRTQENDMGGVRRFRSWFSTIHLRRVDPFREIEDPFEPSTR